MRIVTLLSVIVLCAVGALALVRYGTRQETLLVGAVLLLLGIAFMVLARRQLGDAFAVTPQAKGLVTRGLYAKIPHPMYVFLDVALLGSVIMLRQAWLLIAWAILVVVQVWQARREATVLKEAFGNAYVEYRRGTWW